MTLILAEVWMLQGTNLAVLPTEPESTARLATFLVDQPSATATATAQAVDTQYEFDNLLSWTGAPPFASHSNQSSSPQASETDGTEFEVSRYLRSP